MVMVLHDNDIKIVLFKPAELYVDPKNNFNCIERLLIKKEWHENKNEQISGSDYFQSSSGFPNLLITL